MSRAQVPARLALVAAALMIAGCGPKPIFRTLPEAEPAPQRMLAPDEESGGLLDPPVWSNADSSGAGGARAQQLEEIAQQWVGTPYRRGREGQHGTDCSGLARSVLSELGVSLPRSTREQRQTGRSVPIAELSPGDLLFFRLRSSRVNHVGVSLGSDRFLHASSSRGVVVDRLDRYFGDRLVEARRVVDEG